MAQHRDLLPSTEIDELIPKGQKRSHDVPPSTDVNEPTQKATALGHVSHTVSPAN